MVTPNREDQAPGYATLTIESVEVQNGFAPSADFTGTFFVNEFDSTSVVSSSLADLSLDELQQREVFYITIHSVDSGAAGVGSGQLGDGSSLVGFKILETGSYTDVTVPIYPVIESTDVKFLENQQFPPDGGDGSPTVQAAVYNKPSFGNPLPTSPVATSEPVTVTNGLDQNDERAPLIPVKTGEFDEELEESQLVSVKITAKTEPVTITSLTVDSADVPLRFNPLKLAVGQFVTIEGIRVSAAKSEVEIVVEYDNDGAQTMLNKGIPSDGVITIKVPPPPSLTEA